MAAPVISAMGTPQAVSGNASVPWPAHAAGDIGLLFVQTDSGTTLFTAEGFVLMAAGAAAGSGSNATQCQVWWKRATSSSMNAPVVGDGGDHILARIIVLSGCVGTGNPWNVTATGSAASTDAISIAGPTTTKTETLSLFFCTGGGNNSTATLFSAASGSGTNLTSLTEDFEIGSSINNNGGKYSLYSGSLANPGAVGTLLGTCTQNVAQSWVVASFLSTTSATPAPSNMMQFFRSRF